MSLLEQICELKTILYAKEKEIERLRAELLKEKQEWNSDVLKLQDRVKELETHW